MAIGCWRAAASVMVAAGGWTTGCGDDSGSGEESTGGETTFTSTANADGMVGGDATSPPTGGGAETMVDSATGESSTGPVNALPVAVDDEWLMWQSDAQLAIEATQGVVSNDSDPDGSALSVVAFDSTSMLGAAVAVDVDGGFTYTPSAGLWGEDEFTYTVADDENGSAVGTVRVTIRPTQGHLAHLAQGAGGFVIDGEGEQDHAGITVAHAGDVNGDGFADVVVGADGVDSEGVGTGRAYVVFGKADGDPVRLSDVVVGDGGFAIDSTVADQNIGIPVSGGGDVNGDGLDDVIIGAPAPTPESPGPGQAFVVFGKTSGSVIDLGAIASDGNGDGFVINGESNENSAGVAVAIVDDVNGDGRDDIVVGADAASVSGTVTGRAYVVHGRVGGQAVELGEVAGGIGGFVINGSQELDRAGVAIAPAGDANNDGFGDIVVGASAADPGAVSSAGRAYVVFGKADTAAVELSDIEQELGGGYAISGVQANNLAGSAVGGGGDLNGDGFDDVVVGAFAVASGDVPYSGRSYVVFGRSGAASVDLSEVAAGVGGFALDGEAEEDVSGRSVAVVGDVNGDGFDDLVTGAYAADPSGRDRAGRTYVVYGTEDPSSRALSSLQDGRHGFIVDGETALDLSGRWVSGGGDVNGDGRADLIVGARLHDASGNASGRTYVVFGPRHTVACVNASESCMARGDGRAWCMAAPTHCLLYCDVEASCPDEMSCSNGFCGYQAGAPTQEAAYPAPECGGDTQWLESDGHEVCAPACQGSQPACPVPGSGSAISACEYSPGSSQRLCG